jgi:hypothetical protein
MGDVQTTKTYCNDKQGFKAQRGQAMALPTQLFPSAPVPACPEQSKFVIVSRIVYHKNEVHPGIFPPHHRAQTSSGAHPASYQMGSGDLSPGVKLITHLHPVPTLRLYGATPQDVFTTWFLIKHSNNFNFT